jgi:hypothetical protein
MAGAHRGRGSGGSLAGTSDRDAALAGAGIIYAGMGSTAHYGDEAGDAALRVRLKTGACATPGSSTPPPRRVMLVFPPGVTLRSPTVLMARVASCNAGRGTD